MSTEQPEPASVEMILETEQCISDGHREMAKQMRQACGECDIAVPFLSVVRDLGDTLLCAPVWVWVTEVDQLPARVRLRFDPDDAIYRHANHPEYFTEDARSKVYRPIPTKLGTITYRPFNRHEALEERAPARDLHVVSSPWTRLQIRVVQAFMFLSNIGHERLAQMEPLRTLILAWLSIRLDEVGETYDTKESMVRTAARLLETEAELTLAAFLAECHPGLGDFRPRIRATISSELRNRTELVEAVIACSAYCIGVRMGPENTV